MNFLFALVFDRAKREPLLQSTAPEGNDRNE